MIIVHRPSRAVQEEMLLRLLDFNDLEYRETTTMESCIFPGDKSISIGYYNDNIIICEDYLLTSNLEVTDDPASLAGYEQALSGIFPGSEILTVACHGSVNYHLYSLVKNGEKLRFKRVIASSPILEYGDRLAEEEVIYAESRVIEGKRLFENRKEDHLNHAITEDQLMEDFAFGVAQRHLGVKISSGQENALMERTPFKKFVKTPKLSLKPASRLRSWWRFW
jgi:hypothetical protein